MKMTEINIQEAILLGGFIHRSQMIAVDSEAQGVLVAIECYKMDMTPIEFNRLYHMMSGKPTMRADAMLAQFLREGNQYQIVTIDTTKVHIRAARKGEALQDWQITIEDAIREELPFRSVKGGGLATGADGKPLWTDQWRKRPAAMLFARCVSNLVRKLAPHIVAGIYTPEEVMDFEDTRPAAAPAPAAVMPPLALVQAPVQAIEPTPTPAPAATPEPVPAPAPVAQAATEAAPLPPDPSTIVMPAEAGKAAGKKISELSPAQQEYFAMHGHKFPWWTGEMDSAVRTQMARSKV